MDKTTLAIILSSISFLCLIFFFVYILWRLNNLNKKESNEELKSGNRQNERNHVQREEVTTNQQINSTQRAITTSDPFYSIGCYITPYLPQTRPGKLAVSLLIDAIGSFSYLIPGVGEAGDIAWAPIQGVLLSAMYSESTPYAAQFGFIEELLPFTDIIPTATLCWLKENLTRSSQQRRIQN